MKIGTPLARLTLLAALAVPGPALAFDVEDHLDCAAAYMSVSTALPYLPGVFVMFTSAPRAGYAQRIYRQTTPPEDALPRAFVRMEVNRLDRARLAAIEAGEATVEQLIADVHACDEKYGHEPLWTNFDELATPPPASLPEAPASGRIVFDGIDFGDDSGSLANNGGCSDPRFDMARVHTFGIFKRHDHLKADATDCLKAYRDGTMIYAP